jgi:hypothetical protein
VTEKTTMEERWEAMFGDTTSCRCPGLFQLYELQYLLKPGVYYEVFYTGDMTDGTRLWKVSPRDPEIRWDALDPLDPAETGGRDPEEVIEQQFDWLPGEYGLYDLEEVVERHGDGYYCLREIHPTRTIKVPDEQGNEKEQWQAATYRIGHRRMRHPQNELEVNYDWATQADGFGKFMAGVKRKMDARKTAQTIVTQAALGRALDPDDPELVEPKGRDRTPN